MTAAVAGITTTPRMLFIVGRGRSGTTLLSTYLNAVSGVVVAPESLFIMNLKATYGSQLLGPSRVAAFCRDVFREQRMRNWAFGPSDLAGFILSRPGADAALTYTEACKLVYGAQAHFSGAGVPIIIGDKNPHYSLFIPQLAALFPDAVFFHVVRDPRANVASFRRVRFDYRDPGVLAWRWNIYNNAILSNLRRLDSRYCRIRFEDLVRDPDDVLTTTLHALELPAAIIGARRVEPHIARKPWHPRLGKQIDQHVLDEWKEQLRPSHSMLIEAACADLMVTFGYRPAFPPAARQPAFNLARGIARLTVAVEKLLFRLPMRMRSGIMTAYRKLTSTI